MSKFKDTTNFESSRQFHLHGAAIDAPALDAGLYMVATPIGNLSDISLRALNTLAAADVIACEDTRTSKVLMNHYGISTPLIAYHEHNEAAQAERLLGFVRDGKVVALITDAGTPLISDPGFRAASAARDAGMRITPIPGASAILPALVASGLPSDRFTFAGFLPRKDKALTQALSDDLDRCSGSTIIYYESPRRTLASIKAMHRIFGPDTPMALARELTKLHETVLTGSIGEVLEELEAGAVLKGEVVLLVYLAKAAAIKWDDKSVDDLLIDLMQQLSTGRAASEAARQTGIARRDLFDRASALKNSVPKSDAS